MTEEEKKAIEVLKEEIKSLEEAKIEFSNEIEDKGWLQKNINELDKDIFYKNTLLNLIEKQQKENEELRVQGSIVYLDYKILKDKIREKIKELHKEQENEYDGMIQDFIDYLEKLLEEE